MMNRAILAVCLFVAAAGAARAQGTSCLGMDDLVRMSCAELECLYRQAGPGRAPCGYVPGKAIRDPGSRCTVLRSRTTGLLWKGKRFGDGMLVNRWCGGVERIAARVEHGESWLDGQPAIIMDYSCTSKVWEDVRDEMREVAPGLWLGIMYRRGCPGPKFDMFFTLQEPCCP